MKIRNNPLRAFVKKSPMQDRRTKTIYPDNQSGLGGKKGMTIEVEHDHGGSGKKYGQKGHVPGKTHWTETSEESGYRKRKGS